MDYGTTLGLFLMGIAVAYIVAGIVLMIAAGRKRRRVH